MTDYPSNNKNDTVAFGKYVSFSYSITDDKGNVVEQHDLPVGYVYGGDSEMIGGVDKAILGKKAGDELLVDIEPEEMFGQRDEALIVTDDINNVPPQFRSLGTEVQMQNDKGDSKTFYITEITETTVTIDGNHPLAGKPLTIKVNILEVRDAMPGDAETSGIHATNPNPTLN